VSRRHLEAHAPSGTPVPFCRSRQLCHFLLVWRVAILSEDSLNQHPHLSADTLAHRAIDFRVLPHSRNQFACNRPKRFITQNLHCTVVYFKSVLQNDFALGALTRLQLAGQLPTQP